MTARGTCDIEDNPGVELDGVWGQFSKCTWEFISVPSLEQLFDYDLDGDGMIEGEITIQRIIKGTLSERTEELWRQQACLNSLSEQPFIIRRTLELLLKFSSTDDLYYDLPFSGPTSKYANKRHQMLKTPPRLAPVQEVNTITGTKTELNFENTRHRYPWICSLRTKGITAEHLCAVTLLSKPPQPSIIVGPAHCTYLCKDGDPRGARLDTCCCTPGPAGCKEDVLRCGRNPGAAEMDPKEVVILCGEWEAGPTPQNFSDEKYNVVLQVEDIIRHPDFEAEVGVEGGNDIAVFKVNNAGLKDSSAKDINPICLPEPSRPAPKEGFHSGWSTPPKLYYFREFGEGFLPFVADTFKQWHYKLAIDEECKNPTRSEVLSANISYPSTANYPPGLICAKDVTGRFCPNDGDSGAPMMVKNNDGRFYMEGHLSFLWGCTFFEMGPTDSSNTVFQFESISENPLAYTKLSCYLPWVAEQFGLFYENHPSDEACPQGSKQQPTVNANSQTDTTCREALGTGPLPGFELPCIFPFYYQGKRFDNCTLLQRSSFVEPVWRCPVLNISTKYQDTGINSFEEDPREPQRYCLDLTKCQTADDCEVVLDPKRDCNEGAKLPAFSTCKTDCPGGEPASKVLPEPFSMYTVHCTLYIAHCTMCKASPFSPTSSIQMCNLFQ